MKIMVSACLAGVNCKYDGKNNRNEKVLQLMADNEVMPNFNWKPREALKRFRNIDKAFFKGTFGSDELFDWLREVYKLADDMDRLPFEYIELVGLLSNICVISECVLVKTACPEVPVVVDALCTASNDPKLNEAALDVMESLQIKVINR